MNNLVFYLVLYPAIIAFLCCILAAFLVLRIYQNHQYKELIILLLGFLSYSYLPLNQIIFSFLTGPEYTAARTYLGRLSVVSGTLSPLIVWYSMYKLTGKEITTRYSMLILLLPFVLGYTLRSYSAVWANNIWEIDYDPSIALAVNGLMIFWVLGETINLSYENYKVAPKNDNIPYLMVIAGWTVTLMASVTLIIERVVLDLQTRVFIIFGGLGILIIALAMLRDPFAIVPRTIGSKYCVISDKNSGGEIYSIDFIEEEQILESNSRSSTGLFSTAMSGILTLLREITGQDQIPQKFAYGNFTIIIEETENIVGFLICDREITPVRVELQKLLQEFENQNYYGASSNVTRETYTKTVFDKLQFAI